MHTDTAVTRGVIATQQRSEAAIVALLHVANSRCRELSTPDTAVLPVVELTYRRALNVNATRNPDCTLTPDTPSAANAHGFGPSPRTWSSPVSAGPQTASAGGWILYAH